MHAENYIRWLFYFLRLFWKFEVFEEFEMAGGLNDYGFEILFSYVSSNL